MNKFVEKIAQGKWYDENYLMGYSEEELKKIEKLYDIKIEGDFKEFMLNIGRCSGGLLTYEPFIFYTSWSIRDYILFQAGYLEKIEKIAMIKVKNDMKNKPLIEITEYNKLIEKNVNNPFFFSIEWETQYFFINTGNKGVQKVFRYDENRNAVYDTGMDFLTYVKENILNLNYFNYEKLIQKGDLLVF